MSPRAQDDLPAGASGSADANAFVGEERAGAAQLTVGRVGVPLLGEVLRMDEVSESTESSLALDAPFQPLSQVGVASQEFGIDPCGRSPSPTARWNRSASSAAAAWRVLGRHRLIAFTTRSLTPSDLRGL